MACHATQNLQDNCNADAQWTYEYAEADEIVYSPEEIIISWNCLVTSFSKQKKLINVNSNRSEMFFKRKRIAKNCEELSLVELDSVVRDNEFGKCLLPTNDTVPWHFCGQGRFELDFRTVYFELKPISGPFHMWHMICRIDNENFYQIFVGLLFGIKDATDFIIPAWLFKLPIMTEIERIFSNYFTAISNFMTT